MSFRHCLDRAGVTTRLMDCSNIQIVAPAQVETITPEAQGARLSVASDGQLQQHHVQLAIIADGADSPLRQPWAFTVHVTIINRLRSLPMCV